MPKKKKQKLNVINNNNSTIIDNELNFAALDKMTQTNLMQNPYWMNALLRQMYGTPAEYTREQVLTYIKSPQTNEAALKKVHQYLMGVTMFYKRIILYFASILTFDYVIYPTNADEEDLKSDSFKRSYKKALRWLENFKVKEELSEIMKVIVGEDVGFYYIRENDDTIILQRMPTDYCKIVNKTELGYQYAFDLNYFNIQGTNFLDFPEEIIEAYNTKKDALKINAYNWVSLNPEKAFAFKFDETTAAVIPPLSGLFIDALEISEFKQLIKTRTALDALLLLVLKIPLKNDKDAANSKNPLLLTLDLVEKFHKLVKSNIPLDGVNVVSTPMEMTTVDMKNAGDSRSSIVGYAESNFYRSAGVSSLLFESDKKVGSTGVSMSAKTDEAFVMHMYRQFERFINSQLKKVTGRFRFKILFPDITIFNWEEKLKLFLQTGQFGFPKMLIAASIGITPNQLENMINLENSMGLVEKLKPLMSSHTTSGDNDGGRPREKNVSDKGDEKRDLEGM